MNVKQQIQQTFIGTDVSKLTLDVSIITIDGFHQYQQFENNTKGFKKLESWLQSFKLFSIETALFCLEHTGIYTREYVHFLLLQNAKVWMESALHLAALSSKRYVPDIKQYYERKVAEGKSKMSVLNAIRNKIL